MTSEDILQRAKGIVEGDWVEDTFEVSFLSIFNELHHLAQKSALGPKELEQWTQMGIDLMMRGISTLDKNLGVYTFEFFPAFHTLTSYPIDIEKPWVINSIMSTSVDSVWLEKFSVSLDFYHKFFERIKHPKEKPLYFDYGTICIGKGFNRMRSGGVIVTNQRLLSIGAELNKTTEVKHRYDIFYPDIQEKAYYGVLDYVDLKNIISFENIYGRLTKRIELELREIEWIKSSPSYFYGPLFFKAQLSDKVKVGRGHFKLALKPSPLEGFEKREKERQQKLYDEIQSAALTIK